MARWPGTWRVICDVCGFEFASDEVRKRWDNLYVCDKDWEHRHPQDFLRTRVENVTPPFVRPEPVDTFVNVTYTPNYCDIVGQLGVAGYGVAGCMIAGNGNSHGYL